MISIAGLSIFYKLKLNETPDSIDSKNQTESEIQKVWIQFANSILTDDLKDKTIGEISVYKIDLEDPIPDRFNRSCILSKEEFNSTKVYAVLVMSI